MENSVDKKLLSIVVPCYNEEQTVKTFYDKAVEVFDKTAYDYEIIFVNDGSSDKTLDILSSLAKDDKRVKVINFSRNFGQQAAILCGFQNAKGDAVIEADCDLQDPLEVVYSMIEKWEAGFDVVHGRRKKRKGETIFKRATASLYYKFVAKITKVSIPQNTGDFKLYDRKAINAIIAMPERDKYLRGLASWVGFKQTFVDFDRNERTAGETKYTLKKMVNLAKSGIVSNSDFPLYLSLAFGFSLVSLSLIAFVTFIVLAICNVSLPLTAWLFPTIGLLVSLAYTFNGLTNVYLARVYDEVKKRPDFIISDTLNLD